MARGSSVRTTTTRYRTVDAPEIDRACPGCREHLPAQATFCTQCGLCLLEVIEEIDSAEIELEEIEIEI